MSDRPLVRRSVVAAWSLVALAGVTALVLVTEWLRPQAAAPPPTQTAIHPVDTLREPTDCRLAGGREGQEREEAAAQPAVPADVTVTALLDCPQTWDLRDVTLEGEVVGAVLQRDDVAWLQVNDDPYARADRVPPGHGLLAGPNVGIGVLVRSEDLGRLGHVGGPGTRGDLVRVTGTFHRADRRTAEVAIVRAVQLDVLRPGQELPRPVDTRWQIAAALLAATAIVATVAERALAGARR